MIDYATYCRIHDAHQSQGLNISQIARALQLDAKTLTKWLAEPRYRPRLQAPRTSKLDPYKAQIRQWLETHPYSAQQVFQRLRAAGFKGGTTIVKDYVRTVRPRRAPAFLTLTFAPGECAQVDWGCYGSVPVGTTRRKLSFFVHGAVLQPLDVCGIHPLAADGAVSRLSSACLGVFRRPGSGEGHGR